MQETQETPYSHRWACKTALLCSSLRLPGTSCFPALPDSSFRRETPVFFFFFFESDTKCFSTVTTCLQAVLGRSLLPGQQGQGWPTCLLYSQSLCLSDSFDFGSRTKFLLAHAIATGSHRVNSPLILQIRSSQLCVPCFTCDKGLSATCLCPPAGITRFLDK